MTSTSYLSPPKCPTTAAFRAKDGQCVPLLCKSWRCPTCSEILAAQWAKTAYEGFQSGLHLWFWTLTEPGWLLNRAAAFEKIPKQWDAIRKQMQRTSDSWQYIAFVEGQPHRKYMPHFHLLSSSKCPVRIKDFAATHGFGYQAKEEEVMTPELAAWYVSKYCSKQGFDAPKNFRRVRVSQSWPRPPKPAKEQYLVKAREETLFGYLTRVAATTRRDIGDLYEEWMLIQGKPIDTDEWEQAFKVKPALDDL